MEGKAENKNLGVLTPPRLIFSTAPECLRFEVEKTKASLQSVGNGD